MDIFSIKNGAVVIFIFFIHMKPELLQGLDNGIRS